jgi:hypothetical protein
MAATRRTGYESRGSIGTMRGAWWREATTAGTNNTEVTTADAKSHSTHEASPLALAAVGRRNDRVRGSAMSYGFGVLVSARGLLHQSEPSIEITHVNRLHGGCKADLMSVEQLRRAADAHCPNAIESRRSYLPKSPGQTLPKSALSPSQYPVAKGVPRLRRQSLARG